MNTLSSPVQSGLQLTFCLALLALVAAGCSHVNLGSAGAKTTASGAAAGEHAEGAHADLQRCSSPVGTLAVDEDSGADWYSYMRGFGIQSTVPVLRLLAQQSNCFAVVERGRGMKSMQRERDLRDSGELRQGSRFHKGQMAAADYTITPTLIFSDQTSSGFLGFVNGLLPSFGNKYVNAARGAFGNTKVKDAQSMLTLVDNRSGVQVGVAEGSARNFDIGGLINFGGGTSGGLGAFTQTPQGKVIVASLTDAFNNLVGAVKQYRPQKAAGPGGHGTGGKLKVH